MVAKNAHVIIWTYFWRFIALLGSCLTSKYLGHSCCKGAEAINSHLNVYRYIYNIYIYLSVHIQLAQFSELGQPQPSMRPDFSPNPRRWPFPTPPEPSNLQAPQLHMVLPGCSTSPLECFGTIRKPRYPEIEQTQTRWSSGSWNCLSQTKIVVTHFVESLNVLERTYQILAWQNTVVSWYR